MKSEKIIYSAILRKKHTILTEYTENSGNFSQIISGIMDELIIGAVSEQLQYKAKFIYGKYIFHILRENDIYIITMSKPSKNESGNKKLNDAFYFNLLIDIREDISKLIDFKNAKKLRAYSLSSYFPQLKNKIIHFNKGEISFSEIISNKQNSVNNYELLDNKIFNESKQFPI